MKAKDYPEYLKNLKKNKKYNDSNEIHPRAQAKLDELRQRGLLGKLVPVIQPKKNEQEDNKQ